MSLDQSIPQPGHDAHYAPAGALHADATTAPVTHARATPGTLGSTRLGFAEEKDLDLFVDTLARYERGEVTPDQWKAFRLVNGVYSQRQQADAMMIRVKVPQGILGAPQLRALADVAEHHSTGRGHLTTRQNFQFHFVRLSETTEALRVLADAGLTTREACGNSVRNVTACPYAGASALEAFDSTPYADAITRHFLRGPLSASLPRKFKIAFSGCCGTDCAGGSFNDVGFHARLRDGQAGFRVTLGGGLSTLRRAGILAHDFVPAGEILEVAEAVVRVFNRTGDRKRRHQARLKFVIEKLGPEGFLAEYHRERATLHAEGGRPMPLLPAAPLRSSRAPKPRAVRPGLDEFVRTNVRPQREPDRVAVAIRVPLGDLTAAQLRALAAVAEEFSEEQELRTTIDQGVLLRFVDRAHLASLHAALTDAGLAKPGAGTIADVTSCPGAFSCRIAVTASRGMADTLSRALEQKPQITALAPTLPIKISGCPNGCGQHYVAGIGLQGSVRKVAGRAVPQYHLYLGGAFGAETPSFGRLAAKLPARRVPEAVERLLSLYGSERRPGESAEAFLANLAPSRVDALLEDLARLDAADAKEEDFIDLGETAAFTVETSEGECAT
jgi:sulfite reductase beta subunit-like hemoprotein